MHICFRVWAEYFFRHEFVNSIWILRWTNHRGHCAKKTRLGWITKNMFRNIIFNQTPQF